MSNIFGPVVVHQHNEALDRHAVETHIFPDMEAFTAWLESQETTVFLAIEPLEELVGPQSTTLPDFDLVELSPQQPYEPNPLDFCPGCGSRIADFEDDGYEDEDGQRGHHRCRMAMIQRRNAEVNRVRADELRLDGNVSEAVRWERLADEADAAADQMMRGK